MVSSKVQFTKSVDVSMTYFSPCTLYQVNCKPTSGGGAKLIAMFNGRPLGKIPLVETTARIVKVRLVFCRLSTARYQFPFSVGKKSFVRTTICPGLAGEAESANGAVAGPGNVSKSASRSASEFKLYSSNNTAELVWSIVNRKMLVNSEPAPMVKSRGTAFVSGMML